MLIRVILTFHILNQVNCINKGIFREKKLYIYIFEKKYLYLETYYLKGLVKKMLLF